ncbi:MAG: ATP-binding cassette domain-containing protein [Oscillospiraceae bacterium]|nr:ATP-binding cassette domain-containing protein [Oscillospiraceae bacterium]
MNDYIANMFTAEELKEIREQFYYVDRDIDGTPRLFFDNAGGSLRLKKAEDEFAVFSGSVAVVDQDVILFHDTIANNIKMWDESIEDFEMILAARDAQIHDDIMARPGGYQSRIAEGGRDLSGGQRQRLEIARVLAQDPHIVIMDEATSALDARTEYELTKAVKERGVTCIIIAHRLSTIRDCDEIIVLDHGKVMERGTHEELYAKGGYYTELITSD